ncbi:putative arabinose efflux permease, MFS family [Streptoalloteichus tenebrarius]|uniref:Arabinose efflux permease, MFS family n=1 Tax=Streptoalloteichus tenebrarius (strain ATCC 17920 / DSM 40477 / JCM 4838 / CBS 697.72 / NBRC 16177 / NCIMB 11028 / NRRL B-12390 / A12253. 1 / ISP 5477) TaxID=1933 RepID=A0ABT1HLZ6_STRSD|nr:MFS transporter [Streptoalloteichus tenebrarius]MCP2256542.1 putative arabinose efflux permease, MFS family [Streptoalloteichus tenebrarius]BFF04897.1 MFS transporter [Streptoalloteichus tenebrarius]
MANPYRELFSAPGSLAFTLTGFVARLPAAMAGIGLITMVSQSHGSYGLAGAVSATFTVSTALLGPQVSRLVDRVGQRRVILPTALVSAAALVALLLCVRADAPLWTLFVLAAVAGCLPNMSAMVRARWTEIYRESPRLHTAYSFESVVDELTFVIGPALAVSLSTMAFPEAGPMVAAALLAVGVVLFSFQRSTEPEVRDHRESRDGATMRVGALVLLVSTLLAGGVIVGTVDVVSVAFADHLGNTASAGVVVSVYAVGSALSGLVVGALRISVPLPRLLVLFVAGTAVTTLPLLLVTGVVGLSATVFLAGVFFAPTMITIMGLVERIVPAARLTEGMTWVITGLSAGVALGAAVSGRAVDAFGPRGGFVVAVAAGALALALALVGQGVLARSMRGAEASRQEVAVADRG